MIPVVSSKVLATARSTPECAKGTIGRGGCTRRYCLYDGMATAAPAMVPTHTRHIHPNLSPSSPLQVSMKSNNHDTLHLPPQYTTADTTPPAVGYSNGGGPPAMKGIGHGSSGLTLPELRGTSSELDEGDRRPPSAPPPVTADMDTTCIMGSSARPGQWGWQQEYHRQQPLTVQEYIVPPENSKIPPVAKVAKLLSHDR